MWYKIQDTQVSLKIFVKPNAKRSAFIKVDQTGMHIALHAKPVEGEANQELIRFLSDFFETPKSTITLKQGDRSRNKIVILPWTGTIKKFIASNG